MDKIVATEGNIRGKEKTSDEKYFRAALLLIRVSELIKKKRQHELSKIGVSLVRAAVLRHTKRLDKKATLSEISRSVLKSPHGTSMLVTRMEKEGLVKRVKDLAKKNLVRVELTEKGMELHELVAKDTVTVPTMSFLSNEEINKLIMLLGKIIQHDAD